MMRRLIATIALAIALAVTAVTGPAPTPAGAHPITGETWNICNWWRNYYFGSGSGVFTSSAYEVHWWNSHQVVCHYEPVGWTLLYDRISGARAWIH